MAGKGKPGPDPKGSHGRHDEQIIRFATRAQRQQQQGDTEGGAQSERIARHFHWKAGGTSDNDARDDG